MLASGADGLLCYLVEEMLCPSSRAVALSVSPNENWPWDCNYYNVNQKPITNFGYYQVTTGWIPRSHRGFGAENKYIATWLLYGPSGVVFCPSAILGPSHEMYALPLADNFTWSGSLWSVCLHSSHKEVFEPYLRCCREQGRFPSFKGGSAGFKKRRLTVMCHWLVVLADTFALIVICDVGLSVFYRDEFGRVSDWAARGFIVRGPNSDFHLMQSVIHRFLRVWEQEWSKYLDVLEGSLSTKASVGKTWYTCFRFTDCDESLLRIWGLCRGPMHTVSGFLDTKTATL